MTEIVIFTDGASLGNPGPGGWGAVIVLDKKEVHELGGREESSTNNRMELRATLEAIGFLKTLNADEVSATVYTDSAYLVNGITKWIHGWKKNKWKTKVNGKVSNKDIWEKLSESSSGVSIDWILLSGHSGFPGNERADEIASIFAVGEMPKLYHGPIAGYSVPVLDFSYDENTRTAREEKKAQRKAKAFSYLSLVDGVPAKHETWKETEERVKGVAGAKYRKATSLEHEREILAEWGVDPNDI